MRLILHRRFSGKDYTIGSLYIAAKSGNEYFCDTLEDTDRGLTQSTSLEEIKRIKIPHETAIPTGEYKVIVNLSPAKKRMLPRLLDVPGFSGILIHRGNTKRDTSGCILVGENKVKGKVINSTGYEKRLVEILTEAQERGEENGIEIMNYELLPLSESGFSGLKDLQDFAMQSKNPVRDEMSVENIYLNSFK
ncbi:MAG: DUF5675 family protein [Prevotellaceae bacterium]|jgi:hypothetical protein|nr:DUF5675 family protein [Prevotellaceae bacterium]